MWKIFAVILAVLVLAFGLFLEELYRYVFCRKNSRLFMRLFDSRGHEDRYYEVRDAAARRMAVQPHETWTIRSERGEALRGFYYPCGAGGKRIVFLIHGFRSNHLENGGLFYDYYKSRGIDIFCCDHTAHGESEGQFIGYDVFETRDCLRWIEVLKEKFGPEVQIILHGMSMGGGTVLKMSGDCPANVRLIISDSGFSSAHSAMDHQVGPMYGPLRLVNRLVAGYDWNDSDVTESLQRSRIPILFVHGQDDKLVPYEIGPRLYEAYQGEKDCFFPAHTRHIESIYTAPEAYAEKLDRMVKHCLTSTEEENRHGNDNRRNRCGTAAAQ